MTVTPGSAARAACTRCQGAVPPGAAFCPHCGADQSAPVGSGLDLPGYTILGRLGAGGAADVYLAREDHLDRQVAIKVLRRDLDDPKQWRRLQREAQTIARLSSHPHVLTVYTVGRARSGQPYLVTEFLDRGSLGDIVAADGPLPPDRAAQVGLAVADALTAAHELGILHRDVKPGNVLLSQDGRIKLGDFGIARLLEAQAGAVTDVMAFTPEHVAPEVVQGQPDDAGSDVYGLASTVAASVLGRPVFEMGVDERVDAFLARKVTGEPPSLPEWLPAVLARPLAAGLDPDPRRRSSLPELRRGLAAATEAPLAPGDLGRSVPPPAAGPPRSSAGGPPPAPATAATDPVTARGRRGRRAGRARASVIAAAVVAVVALAAAASGWFDGRQPEAADPPDTAPTSAGADEPAGTSAPVTAATAPPATVAPDPSPTVLLTAAAAETYLRDYYDAVAAGDYERTWAQLAPEFQTGTALSFDYYTGFWDDNDLEVGAVELVEADADRAVVNAELRWNGSDDAVVSQFTLRRGDDGAVLIAEQGSVND